MNHDDPNADASHGATEDAQDGSLGGSARSRLPFPVVGIGASAGGISALTALFEALPADSGMAFVVIVHLSPDHESIIDQLIGRVTPMPIQKVSSRTPIESNHVYVISPSVQLSMNDGHIEVSPASRLRGRPVSIDVFFRTLAEVHWERSMAVVLSGTGSDGSLGIQRIKECGGVTLTQSPEDAEYEGMPASAIATGAVDFVLTAAEIGPKLASLWESALGIELPVSSDSTLAVEAPPSVDADLLAEQALQRVMLLLRERSGHDFSHYKRATVLRRLERRLQVNRLRTLPQYSEFLELHFEETQALLKDLLISVTNFFRDPEAFRALGTEFAGARTEPPHGPQMLRAWTAGCATGEEAYSVAIVLSEYAVRHCPLAAIRVFASDIDKSAIAVARAGIYPDTIVADVSAVRRHQFFSKEAGRLRVRKDLRDKVLFSFHNLLHDPPFSHVDLVCCRNLLIYLDRTTQRKVLEVLHFALRPGGLLFLGSSESAEAAGELFEAVNKKFRIYRASPVHGTRRSLPSIDLKGRCRLPFAFDPPMSVPSNLAEVHERLRHANATPSVLTDERANILHSTPTAGAFLRFAPGAPSRDLLDVVRPELRLELRTAIFQAAQSGQSVTARRTPMQLGGRTEWIAITARPVAQGDSRFMLVLFDAVQSTLGADPVSTDTAADPRIALLEQELQSMRAQLQGSLGESATSTEELRASNEELQSINEELRSTTEELETSKEELQSVNEELSTVNQELKTKIEESDVVNDDLKNLIASIDIASIFVDRNLCIKRFTPAAVHLFNLIASDVGRSLLDITHRLDYPALEADIVHTLESLRVVEREVGGPQGRIYLMRALPYRTQADVIDGAVLNFVDITATRRAEEELRIGERRMRMVVESTKDYAIITFDVDGFVTSWNIGAERMFGYAEVEMIGQSMTLIFTPRDRDLGIPQDEWRRAREDGRATDERWHQRKDGSTFYCSGIVTPMYDNGLVGYAKIARDLSDAKRTEAQLEALLVKETQLRAELQAAGALKDDFLAVMSHELKHPLNLISVNAELLSRMPEVRALPTVTRAADVIRRTVIHQAKVIDDLLDLSRRQTGKLALDLAPIDWASIIAHVLDAVKGDVEERQLKVETALEPGASRVMADAVRVEQIIWNLVSNALKFSSPKGRLQVALSVDGADARLDVTDTGQGIDASFMPHVFDLFRQANRGTTRSQGGMGIGLALVKSLAEAHGGRVAVASEGIGRGSRFSVWLPLAGEVTAPRAPRRPASGVAAMHLLLVDDSVDALESFATLLSLEGATVTTASSARQALEASEGARFDLIVSDVAMPEMDGYELMALLRQMPALARVPAIALTGFGRPQDEERAMEAGFDAHLTKPVRLETLLATIAQLELRQQDSRKA